ncbi:DUF6660 family protein [Chryseobacterium sp.]|uniref:DUF6660 family protein n=1 Tax=Chryseobacterium sp. TaxID=1871047 RepID=UPI00289CC0DE|nr:DUF6660 family protein [Chryseobacterium sp.]
MNILRLLLTIYFLVLSLMPCGDVHAQSPTVDEVLRVTFQTDNHSKDKTDVCSPLCSCNCCQITVASFKVEPIISFPEQVHSYYSKKILFQKNDFAYLVYDQIWQPPKI